METPSNDPATNPPPPDTGAEKIIAANPEDLARIEAASRSAILQHNGEQPEKRKRGQRGPDKKPRNISVGRVGNGSDAPLFASDAPDLFPGDVAPAAPTLGPDDCKALAECAASFIEDLGCGVLKADNLRLTGDMALAEAAGQYGKMSDRTRSLIVNGGAKCIEKYFSQFQHGPEVMLGAGVAAYALGIQMQRSAQKKKLKEFGKGQP
jgi:hypothetical protein